MDVVFKMLDNGAFVAGDRDSEMTAYAYPSSPHAIVAKKHPKQVAEEMMARERVEYRRMIHIQAYDAANWLLISGANPNPEAPKNEDDSNAILSPVKQ